MVAVTLITVVQAVTLETILVVILKTQSDQAVVVS
jgi:hypothetical protein